MGLYLRGFHKKEKKFWKGFWWMSYSVGGRQIRESTKTRKKKLAQRILDARLGEIVEARWNLPSSRSPRLKDWIENFLSTVPHESTRAGYKIGTEHLKAYFGENIRLSEISVSTIESFKQNRLKSGVKPATVNRNLSVLRRMLTLGFRQRLIGRNPFDAVDLLPELNSRRQPHILTYEEQEKLMAVASPYLRALIALLTETGLRVSKEGLALKWGAVDFEKSQVTIRESKTMAGRRVLPLSEYCKAELLLWKDLQGSNCSEYVFPNPSNPVLPIKCVKKSWATTLRNAGVKHFPIYNLRATFASRLSAAGIADNFVSQMLGHASSGILQTYSKAVDEYRRDAVRKLDQLRKGQDIINHLG
jgi:integrase